MTLLVISPDYASHLLPLATLATAWSRRGRRVVVATGPSTAGIVESFGFERVQLQLGRGSNPGIISADDQPDDEADSLRGFFAATREGMVPTLAYQARERLTDLMWDPVTAGRSTLRIVEEVQPEAILIDHLAFSARLALSVAGHDYADVVLGHPSALPPHGELYGLPPAWPAAFRPRRAEFAELRDLCAQVSENFTREWNDTARTLDAGARLSTAAFSEHGPRVFYNYPEQLAQSGTVPGALFLGSTRREEPADAHADEWLTDAGAFVYVSLGSFLSVRDDVLRKVCDALRAAGVRAAIASGSTPAAALGPVPEDWLVLPISRRSGCWAPLPRPSPTVATTPSQRRSVQGFRSWCCPCPPTSSRARRPSNRRASVSHSPLMRPRCRSFGRLSSPCSTGARSTQTCSRASSRTSEPSRVRSGPTAH